MTDEKDEQVLEPMINADALLTRLDQVTQAVGHMNEQVGELQERVSLVPRQVRQLGHKVDDMTESISHPRIRDLLHSFLLLYDLVTQMKRELDVSTREAQNYQVLGDQIVQTLRVNGIEIIPVASHFDPAVHKAVETVPCHQLEEDGEIIDVYRPGFRTARTIVRYTEVIVKRYQPLTAPTEVKDEVANDGGEK